MPRKTKTTKRKKVEEKLPDRISAKELTEFKGNVSEFVKKIGISKKGFLKKPRGRNLYFFWWEDKDMLWMNHGQQGDRNIVVNGWLMSHDIERWIQMFINEGHKMYFK